MGIGKFYNAGTDAEYQRFVSTVLGDVAVKTTGEVYFKDLRLDPHGDTPNYIGLNFEKSASTSAEDWLIIKLTYDGSDRVTRVQKEKGSWDNRSSLF